MYRPRDIWRALYHLSHTLVGVWRRVLPLQSFLPREYFDEWSNNQAVHLSVCLSVCVLVGGSVTSYYSLYLNAKHTLVRCRFKYTHERHSWVSPLLLEGIAEHTPLTSMTPTHPAIPPSHYHHQHPSKCWANTNTFHWAHTQPEPKKPKGMPLKSQRLITKLFFLDILDNFFFFL